MARNRKQFGSRSISRMASYATFLSHGVHCQDNKFSEDNIIVQLTHCRERRPHAQLTRLFTGLRHSHGDFWAWHHRCIDSTQRKAPAAQHYTVWHVARRFVKDGALSLFSRLLAVRSREVAASGRLYITFDFQSAADQVWPIVKTNAAQARAPPPPPDPIDQLDRNEALAAPRKRRSGGYITSRL